MNASFNKVFISYASEDYKIAVQLFDFLSTNGFDPWLDKIKLLAGQQWDIEIKKALREADYIILLLSNVSVNKRGYVQREFKLASTYISEKLHSDIYIILCKIDECVVPEFLSHLQWVHYSDNLCFDKILVSLNKQREIYLEEFIGSNLDDNHYSFITEQKTFNVDDNSASSAEVIYFQFNSNYKEELIELNEYIKEKALRDFRFNRKLIIEESQSEFATNFRAHHRQIDFSTETNYRIAYLSEDFLSIQENTFTYLGGAHGNYRTDIQNFTLFPFSEISNEEILSGNLDALSFISRICKDTILFNVRSNLNDPFLTEEDCFMSDYEYSFTADWRNFKNFSLGKEQLSFIFNPYDVTAYAFGQHTVSISYESLLHKFSDLTLL